MQRKLILVALAVALVAALVVPGVAAAAPPNVPTFSGVASVAQTSPGTVTPILDGVTVVGYTIVGETFAGGFTSCSGDPCGLLDGATLSITQDATLYFTGLPDPNTGDIPIAGLANGTFTIGKGAHALTGAYQQSGLSGTINAVSWAVNVTNSGAWSVISESGRYNALKRASGSFDAAVLGTFGGGEVATVTIAGSHH